MFLTKFPINITRRETRAFLSSPYRLHAAIEGSFPEGSGNSTEGRTLWRVDREDDGSMNLFIVSVEMPSLVGLDEQIGWPDIGQQWQTRSYEPLLTCLDKGQRYHFRLVANPVVSRRGIRDERGRSKRIPHLTALQQTAWLVGRRAYDDVGQQPDGLSEHLLSDCSSRAERNGFSVLDDPRSGLLQIAVTNLREVVFKQGMRGNHISLAMVRYDGVLEVTDADLLRHALTHGIGRAKGFGCGLLTLSAVSAT